MKPVMNEAGEITAFHDQLPRKIWLARLDYNSTNLPSGPDENAPSIDSLGETMQRLIKQLKTLFEERPIWTRRALSNQLEDPDWYNVIKFAYHYFGYTFKSGPWRDAIIKYGIDPRTDPKFRIYQTMVFQLDIDYAPQKEARVKHGRGGTRVAIKNRRHKNDNGLGVRSHTFDGTRIAFDGKIWQVCDITDPLIVSVLGIDNIRKSCHVNTLTPRLYGSRSI
jgi:general transcription factor 3C polypeptide 5 (transcription factor C subunit 1)